MTPSSVETGQCVVPFQKEADEYEMMADVTKLPEQLVTTLLLEGGSQVPGFNFNNAVLSPSTPFLLS